MTVLEALKQAKDELNGISVPMPMLNQIGGPVSRAIALIDASVTALEDGARKEQKATTEKAGEDADENDGDV